MNMALPELRLPGNVPGDFFVDSTCIDCDLCRQIAPDTFASLGEQSVVYRQPETQQEQFEALKALVTCPTASIGAPAEYPVTDAVAAYPDLIESPVHFCGFASEDSYGASSYLIVRDSGNVLVDSPRFAKPLVNQISALGGVRWIFLTHRDDVADQSQWAKHFGAQRIMQRQDAGRLIDEIENIVEDHPVQMADDLIVIPTPGHTKGHSVMLFRNRFLFSGDHVWWSDHYESLYASRGVCWYSWPEQIRSMEKLLDYSFGWVLPGHGRRKFLPENEMHQSLVACIARMKGNQTAVSSF
jgi:glyoxylase-like metal-dependent hydrolase (beta-lactamase superfamily II)/ferredoxin